MSYLQLSVKCEPDAIETLSTKLVEFGATGVNENLDSFDAYFDTSEFDKKDIIIHLSTINEGKIIDYTFIDVKDENWNLLWESNYQPIEVENICYVYAPFHEQKEGFQHSILIHPKMAFGTGHHETTYMMLKAIHSLNVEQQTFLDLGCGTGILAIMASKEGATSVTAVDIDQIAVDSLEENFEANNITNATYFQGTINNVHQQFNIVFANINKNILLQDTEQIVNATLPNGYIALSGFYVHDNDEITQQFTSYGSEVYSIDNRNNWSSIIFKKL